MPDPPSTRIIDDSNPQIQYSVGWRSGGRNDELNATTTLTSTPNASFSLKFVGTSISVFGTADSPNNSTFEIDGTSTWRFTMDTKGKRVPRILFYESPTLPFKEHKLVGTNVDKKIILDYLVITSPPAPSNIFSTSTTADITSAVTSSYPGLCEAHPCAPQNDSTSATNRSFIIVGCTLAAVALVGLVWVIRSIWRGGREAQGSEVGVVRPYSVDWSSSDTREKR